MRTTRQVAIFCSMIENGRIFFILVKRHPSRGGFWQSLTGGEEDYDNNNLYTTVIRETKEELGLEITKTNILEIPYSFKFTDRDGIERSEHCFGVQIPLDQKSQMKLSDEHTAIIFSEDVEYLKSLMKYEQNKIALEKFQKILQEE